MRRFILTFLLISFTQTAIAQSEADTGPNSDDNSSMFDEDVELTPKGWQKFSISAGIMELTADGRYNLRFPGGRQATIINFDRLGLNEDDSTYWLAMYYRSDTSRWGAWFGTWQYDVVGFRVWEDELTIGDDLIVPAGVGVATAFDANFYVLEATYSFLRTPNVDLGVGFGVHAVDLETTLAGEYELGELGNQFIRKDIAALAPLPNVVSYAYWKFAPRWQIIARLGWFGLNYDKYDGEMTNLHAKLLYKLSDRWDVEAGYSLVKLDVDIKENNFTEIYDIDFMGPSLSLRFSF